jgi:peroxiredoxin
VRAIPDFSLPDTDGNPVQLSRHMDSWPTILTFNRGNYCPKDRRQLVGVGPHR